MSTKDVLLETGAVLLRWGGLPTRTKSSVISVVIGRPMSDKLTSVDKKVRLPLAVTLALGTAVAACARISSELPNTASPVVDNGSRVTNAAPTNEVLGIQFNEVAVWDKATLAAKDASISVQIDALSGEIRRQRPELFVGGTQLDSFAISVPIKDMTGKKTNTIYPFIVGSNKADQSKSFVTVVLRRADGQGIFAQSLTPMDVMVDGQLRGALVLNDEPVFIFPKSLKEWNVQSDAQKTSADVIFVPLTGERVRIPMSGGKLASPAIYDARVGYATPDVKPTATPGFDPNLVTKASTADFYTRTPLPTATNVPTDVPTRRATNEKTSTPNAPQPTNESKPTAMATKASNSLPEGAVPFEAFGVKGVRSPIPVPGYEPFAPNQYRAGDCRTNPSCDNVGLTFASLEEAKSYWLKQYPNAVLKYEYWLTPNGGVSKVIVELVSTGK